VYIGFQIEWISEQLSIVDRPIAKQIRDPLDPRSEID